MKIKPAFALLVLHLVFVACTSTPTPTSYPITPTALTESSATSTPNSMPPVATQLPQTEPVVENISNGWVIYDDTNNIISLNLDTGETKVLISRKEVQAIITPDKSAYSYTYGYEKPIKIILSPDFTKALISICASLDNKFRCVFEDYIYTLQSKSAIRLQPAPDSYGVYWQWSLDGSKLAGAAWTYDVEAYKLLKFYAINNDGRGLTELAFITNNDWQFAWHPGNSDILPLTFIQNFRSIFTDGTSEPPISMPGLSPTDKVVCIGFSPDYNKVAFVTRSSANQDSFYIARSDFQEISLISTFATDPRYLCQATWSADQNFIHLDYQYTQREETGVEDLSIPTFGMDKVFNLISNQEVALPDNSQICGFAAENLSYIDNGTSAFGLFNPKTSNVINLSDNVKNAMKHCPLQWDKEQPGANVSQGLTTENACHPNASYVDDDTDPENIPDVFDLLEASSTLDGEVLSVVLKYSKFTEYLVEYLTPNVTDFLNGWDVFIDIDNNTLTGDSIGVEYRFSVAIRAGNEPQIGSVILAYDPVTDTYTRFGTLDVRFDSLAQTLNFTGSIAGLTSDSRLIFLSRYKDATTREVTGDSICK
ncbi:MAG: hypothetical protein UZ14_CFX002000127 [Chloroflexi bacterium OLB14]|nr:MAG: hypothetical protein UZ14_CFX002000127 [Chloroflexi bacterium OLB14]